MSIISSVLIIIYVLLDLFRYLLIWDGCFENARQNWTLKTYIFVMI